MPFIVTTSRVESREIPPGEGSAQVEAYREFAGVPVMEITASVSTHAVATLEEARRSIRTAFEDQRATGAITAMTAIVESGGSVGPLPDGTVIEVEPVGQPSTRHGRGQQSMRHDLRTWGSPLDTLRASDDAIATAWVAAYNATQEGASRDDRG